MRLADTITLDASANLRYTGDGYLTAAPRVARTGIQLYYGSELGLIGDDAKKVVRVLRPESEVFANDAMQSFAHRPFTDDHPPVQVDASNWKQYATGQSGAEVVRDGEFIRVPMVLMDQKAIQKFKEGKAEISMGYDCEIDFTSGTDPKYGAFDAIQRKPRGNHYAVVDAARGGPQLRIGDSGDVSLNVDAYANGLRAVISGQVDSANAANLVQPLAGAKYPFMCTDGKVSLVALRGIKADAIIKSETAVVKAVDEMLSHLEPTQTGTHDAAPNAEKVTMSKVVTVDGIPVTVADEQSAAIIAKAIDTAASALKAARDAQAKTAEELAAEKKKASEDAAKFATEAATKDAEIVTLKKQVEDSKLTPAKLDALVKDRALVAGKARAVLGDKLVVDGKTDGEIMRQLVDAKLGDLAKGWSDDQVRISFDTLTAGTKPIDVSASGVNDMASAFSQPAVNHTVDRSAVDKVHADRNKHLSDAWKAPAARA